MSAAHLTGLGVVTSFGAGLDTLLAGLAAPPSEAPAQGCRALPDPLTAHDLLTTVVEAALADAAWPDDVAAPALVLTGAATSRRGAADGAATSGDDADLFVPSSVAVRGTGVTPIATVSHACASALFGLDLARLLLDSGVAEAVVVAGATTLDPTLVQSMRVTGAVTAGQARPFDRARDGIHVGAGAGAVLLERRARVTPRAVVLGCHTTVAGRSAVASDARRVEATVTGALDEAGVRHLACVHAHATGTPQGDAVELDVLSRTVGRTGGPSVPAVSVKGAVGHLLHSAGYASIAAAAAGLAGGPVAGTAHLHDPEAAPNVDLPGHAESFRPQAGPVLVNAFGFGGNNASAVLAAA